MNKGVDYTGVTIVAICHDGNGEYLLNKRSENCRDEHGRWDVVGGGLEFGDSVEDTIRKEIGEEFGTEVRAIEFLGFRDVHREHNGTPTHWIALDFKVEIDREQARNAEPHKFDEVGWFRINAFPEPMHSQYPHFYAQYGDRL